jgi:serine protease Do
MTDAVHGFRWFVGLFALVVLVGGPAPVQARSAPDSFADLAETLLPGVVNISTTQTVSDEQANTGEEDLDQFFKDFLDRQRRNNPQQHRMTSLGSGFVIDPSATSSPTTTSSPGPRRSPSVFTTTPS